MRTYINILMALLLAATFLGSCKKKSTFEGPDIMDLYGTFSINAPLTASDYSVDFTASETVFFQTSFSIRVNWTLTLRGLTSGATYVINGFGNSLDASNTLWNGSASDLPSFGPEQVEAKLTFATHPDILYDTITMTSVKIPDTGVLINNFEGALPGGFFIDYSADGANIARLNTPLTAPQGSYYLNMSGTDNNNDFYLGQLQTPATALTPSSTYFPITTDSNNTYFNVMVYGNGSSNTRLSLTFEEDDNQNGTYNSANEDGYTYEITPNWTGWKMVRIKYADLVFPSYVGAPGVNGNHLKQPDRILRVDFILVSNPSGGVVTTAIDYPIFTANKPFNP